MYVLNKSHDFILNFSDFKQDKAKLHIFVTWFPGGSDGKEYACSAEDLGLIPGLGRSPGEGNG